MMKLCDFVVGLARAGKSTAKIKIFTDTAWGQVLDKNGHLQHPKKGLSKYR
jgi:hypothetical protein